MADLAKAIRILANFAGLVQGTNDEFEAALADAPAAASEEAAEVEVDATPAALDHAASLGVDITSIKGTGIGGRVTKADVAAAVVAQESSAGG